MCVSRLTCLFFDAGKRWICPVRARRATGARRRHYLNFGPEELSQSWWGSGLLSIDDSCKASRSAVCRFWSSRPHMMEQWFWTYQIDERAYWESLNKTDDSQSFAANRWGKYQEMCKQKLSKKHWCWWCGIFIRNGMKKSLFDQILPPGNAGPH